ncbi:MAG: iron-sulfur-binding ferredoxin reductase [Gammaproteobacteria bacterium]|nr:iron-sulfur-binding ferredoxin reductase [Gammaproteobacteria bacterium]MBU1488821.1 iron-sulfur-binding ferredoxin reductase [Gammaproteobacteria bacterium]MBU2218085.1 iron-sulfur-binding ferredoxin reductase [Gammaproteobacteria bacterium]MBU2323216.1 iron-sulfur-binding ferredoxin reductase [Gammaproteobacteria bacterium]
MPELRVGTQCFSVTAGSNLLDALLQAGIELPHSCRAGSCHACQVRCLAGTPQDSRPEALTPAVREQGWRLACQCQVVEDLEVVPFDPKRDGREARVLACDWLTEDVLRLRLEPLQPLRYRAGQHLLLWNAEGIARPYSLASLPGEDPWLEFHLDCRHAGAFCSTARRLQPGDVLRLGQLSAGALHYDADWQARSLWLIGSGTGLAPLYGVLREALRQEHQGPIRLIHLAHDESSHYLAEPLAQLAEQHAQLRVDLITAAELPEALAELRLVARRSQALLCGQPERIDDIARRLYLAGVPRNQVLADLFLPPAC